MTFSCYSYILNHVFLISNIFFQHLFFLVSSFYAGMKDGSILDGDLAASSQGPFSVRLRFGRLDTVYTPSVTWGAWCAAKGESNQKFLTANLTYFCID